MSVSVGIVGLPNVGKSTLFNALLKKQQALAANYPFATVEPNVGIVEVPDGRLEQLAQVIAGQHNGVLPPIKPAAIEFVDIAGLVKGAAQGEGLGNQFLAHIREVDLICHVLRAFRDGDVVQTGNLEPKEDLETVRTELILKDLETVNKNLQRKQKDLAQRKLTEAVFAKLLPVLEAGQMAYTAPFSQEERVQVLRPLCLLTMKPEVFVINVAEDQLAQEIHKTQVIEHIKEADEQNTLSISAKIEADLAVLEAEEQQEYLADLGLAMPGITRMADVAYKKLGLISFLTAGEKECKAWTVTAGTCAPQAAGVIHTDFEKNFIKAQVIDCKTFVRLGGWKKARDAGMVRQEGRDYVMQDGDVVEFMLGR